MQDIISLVAERHWGTVDRHRFDGGYSVYGMFAS
jgi:hypothetical protein